MTIAHGDFRIDNMIYSPDSLDPIAVLDWELSTIGHPLSDFAYCAMMYFIPAKAQPSPGLAGLNLTEHGLPSLSVDLATQSWIVLWKKWRAHLASRSP